ncbi:MAG: response regulator [Lachnospiraceae bacterium]|jgi:signal transduction histidine kinase/ActR/RegA family two-component response regulator|nr:response regulator [Lachnospiraceae bacterium]
MGLLDADVIENLLHSSSISKGVERTMECMLHELEMDSMYIVKYRDEIARAEVVFEWEMDNVKRNIDFDEYINMIRECYHFDEDDMFVAKATMVLPSLERAFYHNQSYEAVVEYQMTNHGRVIGYIFLGWNHIRSIDDDELKNLHVLLKLMNEVLIKQFSREVMGQSDANMFRIAGDITRTLVYLIDDEYRVQYINTYGKTHNPEIKIGDFCYKMLKDRNEPCEKCPFRELEIGGVHEDRLYLPYLEESFFISSAKVQLEDNRAGYLMTLQSQDRLQQVERRGTTGKKFVFALKTLYKDAIAVEIRRDIFYNLFSQQVDNRFSYSMDFVLKWLSKVHLDDKQKFLETFDISFLQNAYQNGETKKSIDFRYRTHEGEYHCMNGDIIFDHNSNKEVTVFILFQDVEQVRSRQIEESKQMFDSLMASRSAAEIKGQVLANISHEIRTPINGIMSMSSVARQVYKQEDRLLECLSNIDNYADHMVQVMDSLLETVKVDQDSIVIAKQPFRLKGFLNKIDIAVREKIEKKNVNFKLECKCQYDTLMGDAVRLQQALVALINNAIEFTPISGEIKLSATQVAADNKRIFIRFMLEDTGNSMSTKMKESIFGMNEGDPSIAVDAEHFNLSLASRIIELMGGSIGVNVDGEGTHLNFNLPFDIQEEDAKPVKKKLSRAKVGDFTGKRILVAEDSELSKDAISAVLEVVGFEVDAVENGRKAVIQFVSQPAFTYDAVIMDIHMPFMDGREAAKCIRISGKEDGETLPIIGLMTESTEKDVEESIKAGMQAQLSKPVDVDTLYRVLSRYIKQAD